MKAQYKGWPTLDQDTTIYIGAQPLPLADKHPGGPAQVREEEPENGVSRKSGRALRLGTNLGDPGMWVGPERDPDVEVWDGLGLL